MDKEQIIELVKIYAKKIQDIIAYKEIILYGSWAQDSAHENSDIDVAVVIKDEVKDLFDIESKLWGRCREVDLRIEPLIVIDKDDPAGFRNMVKRTGIKVYP